MSPSILQPGSRRRRRWPKWAALALLVLVAAAVGAYFKFVKAQGNVSHPDVEFTAPQPAPKQRVSGAGVAWPLYGYTSERTRYLADTGIKPPFRRLWLFRGNNLIEFQPVVAQSLLFVLENDGKAAAISARTGKVKWRKTVGRLAAASPAWSKRRVYMVANAGGSAGIASAGNGSVWCLSGDTGRVIWRKRLASASESSPLIVGGRVFVGSQDGTVYSLDEKTGAIRWRQRTGAPVKAAIAGSQGRLFFGDYSGHMWSLRASDGHVLWRAGTSGRVLGRAGNFYATPAVAFGRVYAGNTDGFVYSFAASSGKLAWRRSTGGYVYAAPAVADVPGMPPAVFAGSYSGKFFAFDARSGNVLWSYKAGGKISGAASVIGNIVYYSNLAKRTTTGLRATTGKVVWSFGRGAFNPAMSDGKRLYITGYSSVYAFKNLSAARASRARGKARAKSGGRARSTRGGSSR